MTARNATRTAPRPITPLPSSVADLPPAAALVEVQPAVARYPDRTTAGEPFLVRVRAIAPEGCGEMSGVVRCRPALAPRWQEMPLQALGDNRFEAEWIPENPGDYEWTVELWTGNDADGRPGSSGADELHLLRAERADLAPEGWSLAPPAPLAEIAAAIETSDARGPGVLLLPQIFAAADGGAVGHGEHGHYSIDPDLGGNADLGRLATSLRDRGLTLAISVPLRCGATHPFRTRDPQGFLPDGTPDFLGEGWLARWETWEAVFRYWIVQGIDVFHIPDPEHVPLAFWQHLIQTLHDDFPRAAFVFEAEEANADLRPHLVGAGFSVIEIPPYEEEPPVADVEIDCFCTNSAMAVKLVKLGDGELLLTVVNAKPDVAQSGHVHLDAERLGIDEHQLLRLHDTGDGSDTLWLGTTNFLSLEAGVREKTFRIERE